MEALIIGVYTFILLVIGFVVGIRYHMRIMLDLRDDGEIILKIKDKK